MITAESVYKMYSLTGTAANKALDGDLRRKVRLHFKRSNRNETKRKFKISEFQPEEALRDGR